MIDMLIFPPDDVDLARSPLRRGIAEPTYVLGAFNPGLTRLPSGNLLLMVRVAEALGEPVRDGASARSAGRPPAMSSTRIRSTRRHDRSAPVRAPRQPHRVLALTSLSWLLPVELDADGASDRRGALRPRDRARRQLPGLRRRGRAHQPDRRHLVHDRPARSAPSATAPRSTSRATGSTIVLQGIVLDHQNKDMILFEGQVGGEFMALTRPLGEVYFAYPADSPYVGGPSINFAHVARRAPLEPARRAGHPRAQGHRPRR